ncbi:MAG TPA: AAA family ATPase [Polyangiaceae bacterium]|nr:AAA family ATPase [Polyangiaceae bacterium]
MREELRTLIGGMETGVGPKLSGLTDAPRTFYGRGKELDALRRELDAVRSRSECRSVTLTGGSGLGKTRLIEEFVREVLTLEDPPVRVFSAAARPHGQPWESFTQIFAQRFKLADASGLDDAKAAVRAGVASVLDDRKVGDVLYLLGDLLELEFQPSPLTKVLDIGGPERGLVRRAILKSFVEADAAFGPICFVFDDLHHCHDATLSMLRFLADNLQAPVLFLSAGRSDLLGRAGAPVESDSHAYLHLEPLGELAASALIGTLLTPNGMTPMHLVEQAREVTGGNPGRIEETARFYLDKGTLPPPEGCAEPTADARVDALAPADRTLLQQAAVTGGVFWLGGLVVLDRADRPFPDNDDEQDSRRRDIEGRLRGLAERGFVMRLPDSTFPGDEEYVFKHRLERRRLVELTNPAEAQRWQGHLADWLDGHYEIRSHEEFLELLGEQREKSGASELAALAYLEAAYLARGHASTKRELAYCEKAILLLGEHSSSRRLDVLVRAGEILEKLDRPEAALERFREASAVAYRLDRVGPLATSRAAVQRLAAKVKASEEPVPDMSGVRVVEEVE